MNDAPAFIVDLLAWYDTAAAGLPWREERDPYRIWLAEIMLQQTQVATVIPYFTRFLEAYPTLAALAAAPLDDVLKCWEGLGYYNRARSLHRAARQIVAAHGGAFPSAPAVLQALPGIGRYTANAIASIAFGEHVAALDGNMIRVLTRLYDIADDVQAGATQRHLWALAEALVQQVPVGRAGDFNQALMELGREVCRPRAPRCAACPVGGYCLAFRRGVQQARPVKAPKTQLPHYDMAAGVIWNSDGQVLIAQRPTGGLLGGLWAFPAERCGPGEPPLTCLERVLAQQLGVHAQIGDLLIAVRHAFTHFRITLHAYECRFGGGAFVQNGYADWRWARLDELDQFAFARADRKVIDYLRARRQPFDTPV